MYLEGLLFTCIGKLLLLLLLLEGGNSCFCFDGFFYQLLLLSLLFILYNKIRTRSFHSSTVTHSNIDIEYKIFR